MNHQLHEPPSRLHKEDNKQSITSNKECSWLDDFEDKPLPSQNQTQNTINIETSASVKELEDKLAKERVKANRLQAEIDRLTNQLKSSRISSSGSFDCSRYIPNIEYEELIIESKIGQGGFSEIHKGHWLNLPVAVKVIFDPKINQDLMNEFNNEINKLFLVRHPNIISLLAICKNNSKLAIVTELAQNGSLYDYLHKENLTKEISIEFKMKILKQLIRTMLYLHENGLVHRDLKSQNILLDENYNLKLCDFGLMKSLEELNVGSGQFAGTPVYMAPEIFNRKAYNEKIDVFSFGTIVWELFMRKVPYVGCDANEIKNKVCNGDQLFIGKSIPPKIGNLINKCRAFDADNRPSFKELANLNLD